MLMEVRSHTNNIQVQGNMSKLYLFCVYESNERFFIQEKP